MENMTEIVKEKHKVQHNKNNNNNKRQPIKRSYTNTFRVSASMA
jgi:hypothetical protein